MVKINSNIFRHNRIGSKIQDNMMTATINNTDQIRKCKVKIKIVIYNMLKDKINKANNNTLAVNSRCAKSTVLQASASSN